MNNRTYRQVRLFISSTFRDMNRERDYLVKYIFPKVADYCRKRQLEFIPIDLRWGIPEESSKNGLIVKTCLEEINRTRPFFIGILGSRYGWIPSRSELDHIDESLPQERIWLEKAVDEQISITEMEILYGALQNRELSRACFFLRDESVELPESDKEIPGSQGEQKLKELKKKVCEQSRYPVFAYHSLEEFAEQFSKEIVRMIEEEYPSVATDNYDAVVGRHEYALSQRESFIDLSKPVETLASWVAGGSRHSLVVGESGSGTSTLLARAVKAFRSRWKADTIHYYDFAEASAKHTLLEDFDEYLKKLPKFCSNQWRLLAIDNVSILNNRQSVGLIQRIDKLPHGTVAVYAASYGSPFQYNLLFAHQVKQLKIEPLSSGQIYDFAQAYALRYSKQFTAHQLEQIASAKSFANPSLLCLALTELINFGKMEQLDKKIEAITHSAKWEGLMVSDIVHQTFYDLKKIGLAEKYMRVAFAIAITNVGISERELQEAFCIPQAEWSVILPLLKRLTKGNDANLSFSHRATVDEVRQNPNGPTRVQIAEQLLNYLAGMENKERAARLIQPVWNELVYHLHSEEGWQRLYDTILGVLQDSGIVNLMEDGSLSDIWYNMYNYKTVRYITMQEVYSKVSFASYKDAERHYARMARIADSLGHCEDAAWCCNKLASLCRTAQNEDAVFYEMAAMIFSGAVGEVLKKLREYIPSGFFSSVLRLRKEHSPQVQLKAYFIACYAYYKKGDSIALSDTLSAINKIVSRHSELEALYEEQIVRAHLFFARSVAFESDMPKGFARAMSICNGYSSWLQKQGLMNADTVLMLLAKMQLALNMGADDVLSREILYAQYAAQSTYGNKAIPYCEAILLLLYRNNRFYNVRYDEAHVTNIQIFDDSFSIRQMRLPWLNYYIAKSNSMAQWRMADSDYRKEIVRRYNYFARIARKLQPFAFERNKVEVEALLKEN